jgi:DNA-binding PadR family transcriptional regulator
MEIKPTLLDFAILGLLQEEPLTGYGIRKFFEETALGNYSSSPGTIYPALKRLQKGMLIESVVQKTSSKSSFQITKNGILMLKNWFLKPIEKVEVEKKMDELLLRFAFMEKLIDKDHRINYLKSLSTILHLYINELEAYYKMESKKMPLHGRLAFQYGIDSNKTALNWCKKAISQLT